MDIQKIIDNWIAASNAFDTEKYLEFYLPDAVLDDPSVGRKFKGIEGIQEYFDNYFIGYSTHIKQIFLKISDDNKAHLEVNFTGDFPEGIICGTFDFTFENDKIASVRADLIN